MGAGIRSTRMGSTDDGIFIAIEGIDGAGKTTQVERLRRKLESDGEKVVVSKEPTDGPWGRKIRESAERGRMELADELQAFINDRDEHVRDTIRPALARGEIVILDRYFYSTIAYQGARGNNVAELAATMRSRFPEPDVVFLIDTDPAEAMRRISEARGDVPNAFERQDALEAIQKVFLELAAEDDRIHVVDGGQSIDAIAANIVQTLEEGALKARRAARSV